jgi:hypothetical protein
MQSISDLGDHLLHAAGGSRPRGQDEFENLDSPDRRAFEITGDVATDSVRYYGDTDAL